MSIYGTELKFSLPATDDYVALSDQIDDAIQKIGSSPDLYSLDAAMTPDEGFLLIGVNADSPEHANSVLGAMFTESVIPGLAVAGVSEDTFSIVKELAIVAA